jgi:hypothetical protein
LVALNIFYGSELDLMLDFISDLGPEHCILSSDTFMEWTPPGPEFLRMFLGRLLVSGVDEKSILTMVRDNPALYQLRLLQEISASSGNTFVVGTDAFPEAG